jgi:hypothetical protein
VEHALGSVRRAFNNCPISIESDQPAAIDCEKRPQSPAFESGGDMIARNPKNHADQWLVSAEYFADNFEPE